MALHDELERKRIDPECFPRLLKSSTKVEKRDRRCASGMLDSRGELKDYFSRISLRKMGSARFYPAEQLSKIIWGICADPFAAELPSSCSC
jgi:hypothetical protein